MKGTSILSNKWDKRYIELATQISQWSKDPSSKIGCVAIGDKGQVLAQGYNGFPRNISDNERLHERSVKLKYVVHAEMNTIFNAAFSGISLEGSTFYVVGLPCCSDCAKGIVQVKQAKLENLPINSFSDILQGREPSNCSRCKW